MPRNDFGNFVRERRMDLELTQEQLAERMGGSATQAEISRLERGQVRLPHRVRLEALAVALDVSLASLLVLSGWLSEEERESVDFSSEVEEPDDRGDVAAILTELSDLRNSLLTAVERVAQLEVRLQNISAPSPRNEVQVSTGMFDAWEKKAVFAN